MFFQDGKMTVSELKEAKRVLDGGFLDYFQQTVEKFISNYTGIKNYKDIYTMGLSAEAGVHLERGKDREVVGVVYFHDDGWCQLRYQEPKPFTIRVFPSHKFSLEIPKKEQPFLPSRLVKHYTGLYPALDNAIKETTIAPTRFIPSNKDTLLALEKRAVDHAVCNRLKNKGYRHSDWDDFYVGPDKNVWINVFAGRIGNEGGVGSFFLSGPSEKTVNYLENLQKELESLEKEVLIAISTVKLDSLNIKGINEIERVKEMVLQAEKPVLPTAATT